MRRLLGQLGYALHANAKSISVSSPHRDEQFGCIARQKTRFLRAGLPIISVDTKKKELVGNFKNLGRVGAPNRCRSAIMTSDPRPSGWPIPASSTRSPTAGPSLWEPPMTPPPLRPATLPDGGDKGGD
ncbi:MAG: hypothetical protein KJ072_21215 [Verrucomicrobia bacterium]|nr:hypothetical protein [Verrucomicrobiota bacterium]